MDASVVAIEPHTLAPDDLEARGPPEHGRP
jgi:hypothetical protein